MELLPYLRYGVPGASTAEVGKWLMKVLVNVITQLAIAFSLRGSQFDIPPMPFSTSESSRDVPGS
jgi:hypothetical protein